MDVEAADNEDCFAANPSPIGAKEISPGSGREGGRHPGKTPPKKSFSHPMGEGGRRPDEGISSVSFWEQLTQF